MKGLDDRQIYQAVMHLREEVVEKMQVQWKLQWSSNLTPDCGISLRLEFIPLASKSSAGFALRLHGLGITSMWQGLSRAQSTEGCIRKCCQR